MRNTDKTSASRPKRPSLRRRLAAVVLEILRTMVVQVFGSSRRSKPIGYWARDRYGRWELRVPAYGLKERPPTGWVQGQH